VRRPGRLALAGAAALGLLTHVGPYPLSMVGVPGERVANNAPPTVCLVVLAVVQVALAVRARPLLARLLRLRAVRVATVVLNRNAMTVLLWHFTALVLAGLVVLPLGIVPAPADGTLAWWSVRLATVAALTPVLAGLVAALGRFERGGSTGRAPVAASSGRGTTRLLVAVALLSAGFAVVALAGLSEPATPLWLPLRAIVLIGAGAALVRAPGGRDGQDAGASGDAGADPAGPSPTRSTSRATSSAWGDPPGAATSSPMAVAVPSAVADRRAQHPTRRSTSAAVRPWGGGRSVTPSV
jgi:hypothetical protein